MPAVPGSRPIALRTDATDSSRNAPAWRSWRSIAGTSRLAHDAPATGASPDTTITSPSTRFPSGVTHASRIPAASSAASSPARSSSDRPGAKSVTFHSGAPGRPSRTPAARVCGTGGASWPPARSRPISSASSPARVTCRVRRVAELPGHARPARAGRPGRVVDDRDRGVRALAGHAPGLQRGDQLVGVGHPQLRQAAQVGAVGVKEQPHPFRYCLIRGRDPVRRGLDLSRQPAFLCLRRLELPFACPRTLRAACPAARPLVPAGRRWPGRRAWPGRECRPPAPRRHPGRQLPLGARRRPGRHPSRWRRAPRRPPGAAGRSARRPRWPRPRASAWASLSRPVPARCAVWVALSAYRWTWPACRLPVGLLDPRRFLLAFGVLAELLEPLGVAHRRIGLQRFWRASSSVRCSSSCVELALRFVQLLLSGREGLLGRGEVPAELLVAALRQPRPGGLALGRHLRVPAVVAQEGGRRLLRLGEGAQRVAFLIETAERLGHGRHQAGAERGQRLGERPGQQLLVGLLRQLRLAQLDQQVDQRLVAVRAEAEQVLVHRSAVVGRPVIHEPVLRRSPPAASPG